ncbi:copper chaperone PCu(A)C [Chelativorans salis]|uniref:Copper chaperone PCu(A)C n=1 Tax=Chelativorans salis TaxID=2978478 RepID=A0ABT2LHQ1_9HYPH|nr:copper chaperone PCu(A)C [Chelativorans sp. EGI FJ00035]MCT7373711.1 copper chaperone PCu(A)C [Chelativorans sp. EGI FJ00035]
MRTLPIFLAAALTLAGTAAFAHEYKLGTIDIIHPWARATPPSAPSGGGFVTLTNNGEEADRLVGAASPVAGRAELHKMEVTDSIMKMRPMPDGIAIPAGETVELKPGAFHIMFRDLIGPIEEGERVPLTLTFEKAGSIEVEMAVAPAGAPASEDSHDHGGGH